MGTFYPRLPRGRKAHRSGAPALSIHTSAGRRRLDEHDEQIVRVAHNRDLELVVAGRQIDRLATCRDHLTAEALEGGDRSVDVTHTQLHARRPWVLDSAPHRLLV